MLTNKHVIIALLVAPVLSLLAWFAVGKFVGEQPHAAVPGQVYSLLEKSNCRYASGACDLENGDVSLRLEVLSSHTSPLLELRSNVNLQGVALAIAPAGEEAPPQAMRSTAGDPTLWQLPLASAPEEGEQIRLVAVTANNRFTAEVSTRFSRRED